MTKEDQQQTMPHTQDPAHNVEQSGDADSKSENESVSETSVSVDETPEQKLTRERSEYLEGWQRAQAEVRNLQKRHEEERKMFTILGKEALLRELIPMLDNFSAAMANKDAWEAVDANWRVGIEYIRDQFVEVLNNNGVTAFGETGEPFDANIHEPMESQDGADKVDEVVQQGYKIGDRVVRPAKVKLA